MTGAMMGQTSPRTSHRIPLVDVVAHAKMVHADRRRSDIITTATIYGAAVLATAGFVVAAVVDQILGTRPRRNGARVAP